MPLADGSSTCSGISGSSSTTHPTRTPSVWQLRSSRRSCPRPARPAGWPPARVRSSMRSAITRRSRRQWTRQPCFCWTEAANRFAQPTAAWPPAITCIRRRNSPDRRVISRADSARTCCCGRSCRTRSSRRSVTSPDQASCRTSVSSAPCTSASAYQCPWSSRDKPRRSSIRAHSASSPNIRFRSKVFSRRTTRR